MYRKFIKRFLDFLFSLLGIIVLSPVLLIIAILVRINLGSPVVFSQNRPGIHEKIFRLYKFRSMIDKFDENGESLPDVERLTNFGKILRSTSLDELPELWNILKGDMSIVGPRPLLVQYLPLYNEQQKHRHDVRPGLTGYAQINGRNSIGWEEKFLLDCWYVDNMCFLLDLKIIFNTVVKISEQQGITSETSATMEPFTGSEKEELTHKWKNQ